MKRKNFAIRSDVFIALFLLLGGLTACTSQDDDLKGWVSQQKRQTVPSVKPLQEPKEFFPESYAGLNSFDPFDSQKLTRALLPRANSQANALIAIEEKRRREPLEAYPLDTMSMVGVMNGAKGLVALIKVDNLLYQVNKGNYLGQNYGLIQSISENNVTLREIVQDAAGEWIERITALELQEK